MNGAVIILLLALVASPVINATTLFPGLLRRRSLLPGMYPPAYPGLVQPGYRQAIPPTYYREDPYDYSYGQRSVMGAPYRPRVMPQYPAVYVEPRDNYFYDVFDAQASRRAGVAPAPAATAAVAPVATHVLPTRV